MCCAKAVAQSRILFGGGSQWRRQSLTLSWVRTFVCLFSYDWKLIWSTSKNLRMFVSGGVGMACSKENIWSPKQLLNPHHKLADNRQISWLVSKSLIHKETETVGSQKQRSNLDVDIPVQYHAISHLLLFRTCNRHRRHIEKFLFTGALRNKRNGKKNIN